MSSRYMYMLDILFGINSCDGPIVNVKAADGSIVEHQSSKFQGFIGLHFVLFSFICQL